MAHHDFWNWNSDVVVLEFIPIGLAYHIGISLAAALLWLFACTFAWPVEADDFEEHELATNVETGDQK